MRIYYDPGLKELARQLRNNSTKAEIRLWNCLKRNQMYGYDFHRQKPIGNYIVDFFCNKLRLVVECDGYSHQLIEVWQKDCIKTRLLNQMGIHVLRFSDYQVMRELDNVLWCIEGYIIEFEDKGYTPPSVPPF